jgi:hypothetical protein
VRDLVEADPRPVGEGDVGAERTAPARRSQRLRENA